MCGFDRAIEEVTINRFVTSSRSIIKVKGQRSRSKVTDLCADQLWLGLGLVTLRFVRLDQISKVTDLCTDKMTS